MSALLDRPRPVLMSIELASALGWEDRLTRRTETSGVALLTEADIIARFPDCTIEWGYPDRLGRFTPTVHAPAIEPLP